MECFNFFHRLGNQCVCWSSKKCIGRQFLTEIYKIYILAWSGVKNSLFSLPHSRHYSALWLWDTIGSHANHHPLSRPVLYCNQYCQSTMDTAHRISVTYLTNTANGGSEQVKHCKISSFAQLQLYNVYTQKLSTRKKCEIKVFRKVDQIVDKTK